MLKKDVNGNGVFSDILKLKGVLKSKNTFVIANNLASFAKNEYVNEITGNLNHNGNDQIALFYNDEIKDKIGNEGGADFAKDITLIRKKEVNKGNKEYVKEEWELIGKDNFSNLGKHSIENSDDENSDDENSETDEEDKPEDKPEDDTSNVNIETEKYYERAKGKTGIELKSVLNDIISIQKKLSYDAVWEALKDTDEDPNNPNNIILLYTGRSESKSGYPLWNREHVWAKSHGDFGTATGAGTDVHHLRPADVSVNSDRGHLDFDEGGKKHSEATECFYDSDSWEPGDEVKGDVARMIFYMAVRYEGENGEPDLEISENVNNYPKPLFRKLSILKKWHEQDPVSNFEKTRNEKIYKKWQNNRNPFIDHPEWVKTIWN